MVYPGRFIVLGADQTGDWDVVVYGITGRSPSSKARKLELVGDYILTRPTDPEVLKTGNPDLLVYPALILGEAIVVSNGKQTTDIAARADAGPVRVLAGGLAAWNFEPDAPIFTPRISGCVLPGGRAGLSVLKRQPDGSTLRLYAELPLAAGRGKLVSTYAGENANPLPSFAGEPVDVGLAEVTAVATAEAFYSALRPEGRPEDYRVAVACVFALRSDLRRRDVAIINRHERTPA